jgi:ribose transport system substrate-binding protein
LVTNLPREDLVGLCVQVFDPRASQRVLETARSQGLVVVTMERRVDAANPFLHCGIDQREMGAALADALAELVPEGGMVATLADVSDPALQLRQRGFAAQITRHPNLTVLREFDCGGDPASALRLMQEGTERFPGLDGWALMGGWPLLHRPDGRLLPPGCMLVMPGPVPEMAEHIRAGRCNAAIVADYGDMVTRALEMCVVVLDWRLPAIRDYSAPLRQVKRSNLPEFEAQWARWTGQGETDKAKP